MSDNTDPNRWMHVRRAGGYTEDLFDLFVAGSVVFVAHANALLSVWHRLPHHAQHPRIAYRFHAPALSPDRKIATLPIGGGQTLGTRARIENGLSYLLWEHFPGRCMEGVDEGLTETLELSSGPQTTWRTPATGIAFMHTAAVYRP